MKWLILILITIGGLWSAPQLDKKYTVTYGNPKAPIQIVEYVSFGCEPCVRLFAEEFEGVRSTYIETGQVYWVFHPHPVELATVQAMVCLELLTEHQKQLFFEAVFLELYQSEGLDPVTLMQSAMQVLTGKAISLRDSLAIQESAAFKAVFTYQQSKPEFSGTPTLVINGQVIDAFPTRAHIDMLINEQRKRIKP